MPAIDNRQEIVLRLLARFTSMFFLHSAATDNTWQIYCVHFITVLCQKWARYVIYISARRRISSIWMAFSVVAQGFLILKVKSEVWPIGEQKLVNQ